jgi:DNA-binding response OmpR family regulator
MDIWRVPGTGASVDRVSAALVLAEPEPSARSSLSRHLSSDGFAVHDAAGGDEALTAVERLRPDLVLLGGGGVGTPAHEVCSRLRRGEPGRSWNRDVAVIVLGRDGARADDRVLAFDRGCDDYMPRPFVYEELVARIRAVLRRVRREPEPFLVAGAVTIDRPTRTVRVAGRRVDLSAKEYELLLELASEPRRVFTRSELLETVWRYPASCRTRTIDSHASRLRRKLEAGGAGPFVLNVWGVGYRLLDP